MALTDYVTLGRSGLKVSPMCLGTMTFGEEWAYGAPPAVCEEMLDHFRGAGGNFVDTANMYTEGHSETILGDYFERRPGQRDRMVIATKFSGNLRYGDPNGGGAGRKAVIAACEESLRRLKTDHIDLYWMHWSDPYTPIEETMSCLDDLVRAGKVRYIGFSDTPAWRCTQAQFVAAARGWAPLIGLQIEYSLIERTVEGELMPMARELGLGVTPWSPLGGGALSGKYGRTQRVAESAGRKAGIDARLDERTFGIIDVLAGIADETGATVAQIALAWVCARRGVTAPIVGARTPAQLTQNLAALDLRLTVDQIARLDQRSQPTLGFPQRIERLLLTPAYGGLTINGDSVPRGFRSIGPDTPVR